MMALYVAAGPSLDGAHAQVSGDTATSRSAQQRFDARTAKARVVLEAHCARCHQAGMLKLPEPAGQLGDILDLDRIAADPGLVVAGNADASLLYTLMLRREMPSDIARGQLKDAAPTPVEIEAVRDWIEALPTPEPSCANRPRISPADIQSAVTAAQAVAGASRSGLRFVTLAHLHNMCAGTDHMEGYRQAVAKLLNGLAGGPTAIKLGTVDAQATVLSVPLSDLGLDVGHWDKLVREAPAIGLAVPGDWLAAMLTQSGALEAPGQPISLADRLSRLEADAGRMRAAGVEAHRLIDGLELVSALARAYMRNVTLRRAAEDLGLAEQELVRKLDRLEGPLRLTGQRLQQGPVPRASAEQLFVALSARPSSFASDSPVSPPASTMLDLTLVPDKAMYKVGEVGIFTARTTAGCALTLISVSAAGKATVLFPNDFEQDNRLTAGRELRLPTESSPYQFRFTQAGTERLVGICMTRSKMADGIVPDYEHQRFTALGDWRNFLRSVLETDEVAERPDKGDRIKSKSLGQKGREGELVGRVLLEPQVRTAVTIRVAE